MRLRWSIRLHSLGFNRQKCDGDTWLELCCPALWITPLTLVFWLHLQLNDNAFHRCFHHSWIILCLTSDVTSRGYRCSNAPLWYRTSHRFSVSPLAPILPTNFCPHCTNIKSRDCYHISGVKPRGNGRRAELTRLPRLIGPIPKKRLIKMWEEIRKHARMPYFLLEKYIYL